MLTLALVLVLVGFAVALPAALVMRSLGHRLMALDGPGVSGQIKDAPRRVPNTGGLAIYLGVVGPMLVGLVGVRFFDLGERVSQVVPALREHLPGIVAMSNEALALIAALSLVHILGVVDDRRPINAWLKLTVQTGITIALVLLTGTRLLTAIDSLAGGLPVSTLLAVLWIVLVTNALNFMDNMDGLTGGVAVIAGACFLAAALLHGQWFIASCLALLVGSCGGFLVLNFPAPRATIFMGDAGSTLIGLLLGFLTVRTTFYDPALPGSPDLAGGWYAVFMPVLVLAVPLYDLASVVVIRLRAGRSPMIGDLNHLSHRLVRRGLSKRDAVLVIYGLTLITSLGAIPLGSLQPWQALLAGVQTIAVLVCLTLFEARAITPGVDPHQNGRA